jgi:hypothetical protein
MQSAIEPYSRQNVAQTFRRFLTYVTFLSWVGVLYFQDAWSNHANRILGHNRDASHAVSGPSGYADFAC